MFATTSHSALRWPLLVLATCTFAVLLLLPEHGLPRAAADGEGNIIMVEEDWRLVLNEPGEQINAPQFHTGVGPDWDPSGTYAQLLWNYREDPEYAPGGVQLEGWANDERIQLASVGDTPLSNFAETITWTQRLGVDGQQLTFQIMNGQSTSWGSFGPNMTVQMSYATAHLNQYSPLVSRWRSGVTYGLNRVNSLVITEVRRYTASGLYSRDTTPIVIFQQASGSGGTGQ